MTLSSSEEECIELLEPAKVVRRVRGIIDTFGFQ